MGSCSDAGRVRSNGQHLFDLPLRSWRLCQCTRIVVKGLPCFQEAYHIPALVGGAGIHGETPVDAMVSITDFAPTILELAGISAPDVAGRSLVPFLRHQIPCDWRTELFTQSNGNELYGIQRAVWNKKWKYVFNGFDYDELYDLENDPRELHNLIYDPSLAAIVREMCGKLWQFAYKRAMPVLAHILWSALPLMGLVSFGKMIL